jgi:hypothetical protein
MGWNLAASGFLRSVLRFLLTAIDVSYCRLMAESERLTAVMLCCCGGERGPVTFPAFKAGDAFLRGTGGGFDFHTPPPNQALAVSRKR